MLIHGRCHCGNLRFELDWRPEPAAIPARACDCGFCTRHGGVWTSCPAGALRVTVEDPAQVNRYTFATRTAVFHVCRRCGVVPLVTSSIEGREYAVVNVNSFDGLPPGLVQPAPVSFGNETEAQRLARRARNWIADVRFA
ncbi:GFA family protein [Ramlibacter humi]|uniref:CENP-V/GFA domain-containing protein n=1 Tax=Ramlibacter humi TaxID=2530451 RepID=A0A4Z0BAT4_9BURK|nr:hypothetical protein [Ramlibacter humi]TFY96156.1 hypothetical protein EZ216_21050 [Ramlibacter humi]